MCELCYAMPFNQWSIFRALTCCHCIHLPICLTDIWWFIYSTQRIRMIRYWHWRKDIVGISLALKFSIFAFSFLWPLLSWNYFEVDGKLYLFCASQYRYETLVFLCSSWREDLWSGTNHTQHTHIYSNSAKGIMRSWFKGSCHKHERVYQWGIRLLYGMVSWRSVRNMVHQWPLLLFPSAENELAEWYAGLQRSSCSPTYTHSIQHWICSVFGGTLPNWCGLLNTWWPVSNVKSFGHGK